MDSEFDSILEKIGNLQQELDSEDSLSCQNSELDFTDVNFKESPVHHTVSSVIIKDERNSY